MIRHWHLRSAILTFSVALTSIAPASVFRTPGTSCVEEGATAPHIIYGANASAINSDAGEARLFHCSGSSISTSVLQNVTVTVVDQNATQAVECTAFNGNFSTSSGSIGTSAAPQTLVLDLPDATWFDARVVCLVPKGVNGVRSSIVRLEYNTL